MATFYNPLCTSYNHSKEKEKEKKVLHTKTNAVHYIQHTQPLNLHPMKNNCSYRRTEPSPSIHMVLK